MGNVMFCFIVPKLYVLEILFNFFIQKLLAQYYLKRCTRSLVVMFKTWNFIQNCDENSLLKN